MRVTVSFESDRDGRPRGAVLTSDGKPGDRFDGWLELLRALERVAYDVETPEEAAS